MERKRYLKLIRPMSGGKPKEVIVYFYVLVHCNLISDSCRDSHGLLMNTFLPGKAVQVKVGIYIVYIGNFRESDMVRYLTLFCASVSL